MFDVRDSLRGGEGSSSQTKPPERKEAMSFFCRLSRRHYWCTPHRSSDRKLIQVCYECGAERPASELVDDLASERFNNRLASAKSQLANPAARMINDGSGAHDRLSSTERARKFALVK